MLDVGRRYHVREVLGRGGFGTVYRAELVTEGGFGKIVALKVLHSAIEGRPGQLARLRDEARLLGIVRHRALVGADALIRLDGRWTVVMEYVPGATVHEILTVERKVPPSAALRVVEEVADALEMMWSADTGEGHPLHLLHRDLKPNNLQLTHHGDVKVLDFGLAQADFDQREAQTCKVVYGSPPYLSPERLEANDTPAGDVFALGATLAEMLTGRRPEPVAARPQAHEARIRVLLEAIDDEVQDPSLTEFVARTLAYEMDERPTMEEVRTTAKALRKRHREPELRDWAKLVVPKVQSLREVSTGELSGRSLEESVDTPTSLDGLPGAAARTWEPEPTFPPPSDPVAPPPLPTSPAQDRPPPLPPPPNKPPPGPPPLPPAAPAEAPAPASPAPTQPSAQAPTGCMAWVKGMVAAALVSIGALGAAVLLVVVGAFLLVGLSCWAVWPSLSREMCVDDVAKIDMGLDRAKGEGDSLDEARALTNRLDEACRAGKLSTWDITTLEIDTRAALEDRIWSRSDQRRFAREAEALLRDVR